ncbi:MAG: glycosyltransferase family protein [bacterium]
MNRRERVRTIGFYAKGESHWRRLLADTIAGAFRLTPERIPAAWHDRRFIRSLVNEEFRVLSYLIDWKEAFSESPLLDIEWCNINNLFEYRAGLRKLRGYPLGIVLHSAAWDHLALLRLATGSFQARRGKLLVCFGNEYHNMKEKIGFAKAVVANYIGSQLPLRAAQWLYADCARSTVLPTPQALNPKIYQPQGRPRPIDIGFRGDMYAHMYSLGDVERATILRYFDERAESWGLVKDIAFVRYPRDEWSRFLGTCKGIVGAESGTYYLERDDHTQEAVKRYLERHPEAGFPEVYGRFFKYYPNAVSGKAISSRHFEPIGTKTCQILLEGHYNGILKADEHYISLQKDFSNVDEAIRHFKDQEYRQAMAERAYEYVLAGHTYRHRVESLLKTILEGEP